MKIISLSILSLSISTLCFAKTELGNREVLLNNDLVEVVRLTYPVGSESGVHTHSHPNRVVYFVKGGKLALIPADAKTSQKIIAPHDGDTLFLPATTHNVKNIGTTEIVIVETEIKEK